MIAVHGAFDGSLLVWREPDGGKAGLAEVLASLDGVRPTKLKAWLPAVAGKPEPSSPILGDTAAGPSTIVPFSISAAALLPKDAVEFLTACIGKHLLSPGVLIGDDLAYWAAAMQFAAGLVRRGRFLPAATTEPQGVAARWTPIYLGPDAARLHSLAKAMPPSARALSAKKSQPDTPAETVLTGFVAFILDHLVRTAAERVRPLARNSVHDHWLSALTAADPAIRAQPPEIKALTDQVSQWQRVFQRSTRAPFRLSFRLREPQEDAAPWRIEYLLQGTKDPSLFLPAADVWKANPKSLNRLGHNIGALREHLLASLGEASALCTPVEESLKGRDPEGHDLDLRNAYEFLRQTAPALEQSGFGLLLPSWWTRKGSAVRLKARARVKGKLTSAAGLGLDTVLQFDWQLALGGEQITKAELTALARLKAPLVKVRGQWVEVNSDDIKAALDFLKKNESGSATARDLVRMELAGGSAGPLEVEGIEAEGWLKDMLDRLEGRAPFTELPQPERLTGELRPYQRRGFSWLQFLKQTGLGACLADDMGLGKTIQTLALLQHDWDAGERRPTLLVCPTSVTGNWQKEAAKFAPGLPVLLHHGIARNKGEAFQAEAAKHAIVISTYALLHRDHETLKDVDWAGVILDEAQNIKNAETKQARAARALKSGYRVTLTGTPVENNVGDLWSLMEFLNPGFLGSQSAFRTRFFVPIQVYGDPNASDRLRRITGPFILRRLKTDKSIIADLPDKLEMKVFCNLTREQASLYEAVAKDAQEAIESSEGIARKGIVLATLLKLKQVCNHPAQFLKDGSAIDGRSGKLTRLSEMMEETLQVGDRSLIFTQFTEMGDMLQRHLQESFGYEVLYLHGGSSKKQRDAMVERFAEADGPRIFLLSLKAGGTGLNLTQANHVFHFDRWWNPAVENQATDRAFRIGQTRNVQVHKFVCAGTLEEKIDEMIERKKGVAGRVVGTGEAWLSELSNEELRGLFALRDEAVSVEPGGRRAVKGAAS